jgi:hypothetical protein
VPEHVCLGIRHGGNFDVAALEHEFQVVLSAKTGGNKTHANPFATRCRKSVGH